MTATAAPSAPGTPGAPQGAPAALPATKPRGMFLRGLEVFLENKLAVVGVVVLAGIFIFCFLGPYFYHTNQVTVNLANENLPPGPGRPARHRPERLRHPRPADGRRADLA